MAKKSYEETIYEKLCKIEPNKWFKCPGEPEYDKFVRAVKSFINMGDDFEFSNDYKKIRLVSLSKKIDIDYSNIPGYRKEDKVCEPDKYGKQAKYRHIFINDKLVSAQSL